MRGIFRTLDGGLFEKEIAEPFGKAIESNHAVAKGPIVTRTYTLLGFVNSYFDGKEIAIFQETV